MKHILKDTFDFIDGFDKPCNESTQVVSWDIKFLYTYIRHDVFYNPVSYWVDKYKYLPLLQVYGLRKGCAFSKACSMFL